MHALAAPTEEREGAIGGWIENAGLIGSRHGLTGVGRNRPGQELKVNWMKAGEQRSSQPHQLR